MSDSVTAVLSYSNIRGSSLDDNDRKFAVELLGSRITVLAPHMPGMTLSRSSVNGAMPWYG